MGHPGLERYRTLVQNCIRNVNAVILVYNVDDRVSFIDMEMWFHLVSECRNPECVFIVGNKTDPNGTEQVSEQQAIEFANRRGNRLFFTSCIGNGEGINEVFSSVCDWVKHKGVVKTITL